MVENKFPLIYILILNWNGLQDTLECLESVFKMDYQNFEVIVVDNASTDDSVEVIRESYPHVILIENKENLGYTGGNNVAMKYAMQKGADYVWLLNNDTIVEVDTLSQTVTTAEVSDDVGLVSPVIYYYDHPERMQFCGSYIDRKDFSLFHYSNLDELKEDHENRQICLWGTALLINKLVIEKIGYLDDTFFAYWEDTDYSLRVLKAGYRNYVCSSASIYHKVPLSGTIQRGPHYFYYMSRNRYFIIKKYFKDVGKLTRMKNQFSYIVLKFIWNNMDNNKNGANACLDGFWSAMKGVKGPWNKDVKMPAGLKKLFHSLFSIHPAFWVCLLKGDLSTIVSEGLTRARTKLSGFIG